MEFIKTTKQYKECKTEDNKTNLMKNGFKYWALYVYIQNIDKLKYGKLMTFLIFQYSPKTD